MSEQPALSWKDVLDSEDDGMELLYRQELQENSSGLDVFSRHAERGEHRLVVGRRTVNGGTGRDFDGSMPNGAWFIGFKTTF